MAARETASVSLGIAATLLLAWIPLLLRTNPKSSEPPPVYGRGPGPVRACGSVQVRNYGTWTHVFITAPEGRIVQGNERPPWDTITPYWVADRAREVLAENVRYDSSHFVTVVACGWPLRALKYEYDADYTGGTRDIRGGWVVPHPSNPDYVAYRRYGVTVPWLPVWAGLTADVAVFTAISWITLSVMPMSRRIARRSRGQCTRCGYSLRGLAEGAPCPECGKEARLDRRAQ